MKCKNCKNTIPDGSLFCMYCGEKQVRNKSEKKETKVPKPKQLKSGNWYIWLEKEKTGVTEPTPETCIKKARAIRDGFLVVEKEQAPLILEDICNEFIEKRVNTCSSSTLHGYDCIVKHRFKDYMKQDVSTIDWQKMINDEAKKDISAKTIKNAWGFIAGVLNENDIKFKSPTMPQVIAAETKWLDYDQIEDFLDAIKGRKHEIAILLCLHGLRRSEVLSITPQKIIYNKKKNMYEIHVEGATVRGRQNIMVQKEENKNSSSRRVVPVMIHRLIELIKESDCPEDRPYVIENPNVIYMAINDACESKGLPKVGCHGLRRTYASLSYHLGISELQLKEFGGWQNTKVLHDHYTRLASKDRDEAARKLADFYTNLGTVSENT